MVIWEILNSINDGKKYSVLLSLLLYIKILKYKCIKNKTVKLLIFYFNKTQLKHKTSK